MEHEIILGLVGVWASAGSAAWVAVKVSLNGMAARQQRMETKLDDALEEIQENRVTLREVQTRCIAFHPERFQELTKN